MSRWRPLKFANLPESRSTPQFLVKPCFTPVAYTVFLTDLSYIWREELNLDGIVNRAEVHASPIEVSTHDTSQLTILLQNIEKSLAGDGVANCVMGSLDTGGINLLTTIALPEPLGSLEWEFKLRDASTQVLRNELILPLLISAHMQNEGLASLIAIITEKDRAMTRLLDQFESSNLDLASAFPSMGGIKTARRLGRRDLAAKYVPGLQIFDEQSWMKHNAEIRNIDVSAPRLLQSALSDCTLWIPECLKLDDTTQAWRTTMDLLESQADRRSALGMSPKHPKPSIEVDTNDFKVEVAEGDHGEDEEKTEDEEETEDEFEIHEHFKSRNVVKPATRSKPSNAPAITLRSVKTDEHSDDASECDLDKSHKLHGQSHPHRPRSLKAQSPPSSSPSSPPSTVQEVQQSSPVASVYSVRNTEISAKPQPQGKGFRIGGKAKEAAAAVTIPEMSSQDKIGKEETLLATASTKRPFKIGGKSKAAQQGTQTHPSQVTTSDHQSTVNPPASTDPIVPAVVNKREDVPELGVEETAEQKAERKRLELKRKNEELAKKQALARKKKRF